MAVEPVDLDESSASDVDLVNEAQRVYQGVREYLRMAQGRLSPPVFARWGHEYVLSVGSILGDQRYSNLRIAMTQEKSDHGASLRWDSDLSNVVLNLPGVPGLVGKGDDALLRTFVSNRRGVIHEMVHFLDLMRIKEKGGDVQGMSTEGDRYWTHPLEYNAYYSEIVSAIKDRLENPMMNAKARQLVVPRDFKSFLQGTVIPVARSEFVANMDDNHGKKLLRRLYKLHQSLTRMIYPEQ